MLPTTAKQFPDTTQGGLVSSACASEWPYSGDRCRREVAQRAGSQFMSTSRLEAVTAMPFRVLVCDDQALVRAGFTKLLEAADGIEVVGEAADGATAVDQATRLQPDVVLMDIRMPVLDG